MYRFGRASEARLETLEPDLARVVRLALSYSLMDFSVVSGGRTQAEQNALYEQGRTTPGLIVTWTKNSNHLVDKKTKKSSAVDIAPYYSGDIQWKDEEAFKFLAGLMFRAGMELGINIEWGGHWKYTSDMPHFQLKES